MSNYSVAVNIEKEIGFIIFALTLKLLGGKKKLLLIVYFRYQENSNNNNTS